MSYKTLILVDNSDSITTLNREIIDQTIKYILKNADDENSFAIATVGNKVDYLTEYEDTLDTKYRSIELIEYEENVSSCKDALMEVIVDWKENDFAGRDIVLISDGHESENSYTTEELYFEINTSGYPVYVVGCVQDDNSSRLKSLSAIARISKGGIFYTEFEGSDASVEKQIGQEILNKMREDRYEAQDDYVNQHVSTNDLSIEDIEQELKDKIYVENDYAYSDNEEESTTVIYEMPEGKDNTILRYSFIIPVILLFAFFISIMVLIYSKRRKRERNEEERFLNNLKSSMKYKDCDSGFSKAKEDVKEGITRTLTNEYEDEDGGTRLLFQASDGVDITLEDRADPTKYFRACIRDRIVIGRSKQFCDIALSYDDSVSSKHCEIFLRGDELYVRDLSSANGTLVNQQKVYQEIKLNSGDILKLGQLSMYLQIVRRDCFAEI